MLAVTKEEEEEKEDDNDDDNNEGQFGECAAGTHRFDELALNQIKYCNHFSTYVQKYLHFKVFLNQIKCRNHFSTCETKSS